MKNKIPLFKEWLNLNSEEQKTLQGKWNCYAGEGKELIKEIIQDFKNTYNHISGIKIEESPGVYHGGFWVISISYPFIFDRRKIPQEYLGILVHCSCEELPEEFIVKDDSQEYVWSPDRYEKFVDRCTNQIRNTLGNPNMTRKEMLDALVGKDFKKWIEQCRNWVKEGKIPNFE